MTITRLRFLLFNVIIHNADDNIIYVDIGPYLNYVLVTHQRAMQLSCQTARIRRLSGNFTILIHHVTHVAMFLTLFPMY